MVQTRLGNLITGKDGLTYGKPRKQYTRTKPIPKGFFKIKNNPRENVAIIKLRRLGYSINQLANITGRSTSYIHKRIHRAIDLKIIHMVQMRKLPSQIRLACSASRRRMLQKWFSLWEAFILGEVDKPP